MNIFYDNSEAILTIYLFKKHMLWVLIVRRFLWVHTIYLLYKNKKKINTLELSQNTPPLSFQPSRSKQILTQTVDPDETARYEPSHQDLHCLHLILVLWRISLFAAMDLSKFRDRIVHCIKLGDERINSLLIRSTEAREIGPNPRYCNYDLKETSGRNLCC